MTRTVLISGASSGIGYATAKLLTEKGYHVIGISRKYPKEEYNFDYYLCDISNQDQVINLVQQISKKIDKIDVLINCAGMGVSGAIEYSTLEELKKIFDVNVFGQFILTKNLISLMRKSTKAKIINIGSVAGELTIPFQTFYSMTKSAINSFSEGLRIELKPFNIQVTTVLPGDIKTDFTKNRQMPNVLEDDVYFERIKNSLNKMAKDEEQGMSPVSVAKIIYKLTKRRRLPVSITVGFKYKLFVFLKRLLPKRLINYIIAKMYG